MGKALYRKHRPKKLSEVVGQEHITTTLQNAINKKSFSHAYLFTGPRGVGKTTIARILAHEINGISYDNEDMKLDIIEIDAASNNRIDEIREIREKLHISPAELKYKIYIIDEVHMLTKQAFNALLKTLEEPPEHVIFILATTESHKIPDTIISRTQRFSFKPIDQNNTVSHLRSIADKESLKIEDGALTLLAEHGRGSFRDSISMMDQISGIDSKLITADQVAELLGMPDAKIILDILSTLESNDINKIFDLTQTLREKGINPATVSKQLIIQIRDQLASGNNKISVSRLINLMRELLPITGNYGSFEALEITLLNAIPDAEDDTKIITSKSSPSTPRNTVTKEDIIEDTSEEPKTEALNSLPDIKKHDISSKLSEEPDMPPKKVESKSTITSKNSVKGEASWVAVIDAVKNNHNTLYGILRMAIVDETDDTIKLTFKFEFHKKQIEQAKNLNKLQLIVDEVYKKPIKITLKFSKSKEVTTIKKVEAKQDNDNLKSVSNIFGGAELLES